MWHTMNITVFWTLNKLFTNNYSQTSIQDSSCLYRKKKKKKNQKNLIWYCESSHFTGPAVRRYLTSKVRDTLIRW